MYGPCRSTIGGDRALTPPRRQSLGRPLPYQLADTTQAAPEAANIATCLYPCGTIGNYPSFRMAMPDFGGRTYVLLPRLPVALAGPLDLHDLSTPPAFILSQDQTL